jgi:competence CoiA-like predicted nuclease
MEEVKIIYCYDENKNPVHYTKTKKGDKYFCIDCGAELICKDGDIKIKHLAHKNSDNCGGTGESIFHKHWKENLFKAGMYINIANRISEPNNIEILDVLNEVSLGDKYDKKWDIKIIADVLLVTELGDIVVEINYKNPKDWNKLQPYFNELNLLRVYEVTVDKNINTQLEWFCLGEEEEINALKVQILMEHEKQRQHKEQEKKKKKEAREKAKNDKHNKEIDDLKKGVTKIYSIMYNSHTDLQEINENTYILPCIAKAYNHHKSEYTILKLKFDLNKHKFDESKLYNRFKSYNGIKYRNVVVINTPSEDGCYEVIKIYSDEWNVEYDKQLYAKICNVQ